MFLFNQNSETDWYNIQARGNPSHVDIDMFGIIGWSVSARGFAYQLNQHKNAKTITVRINTVGGDFYNGLAIYNLLKQHPADVTVKVMGYALSMGSIIMLAGDTVEMAQNSLVMIHRAQGFSYGDVNVMKKAIQRLEVHERAIIPDYQQRMGLDKNAVLKLLDDETWYTANEAQNAGLIDEITNKIDLKKANKQIDKNAWQQTQDFNHSPDDFQLLVQANTQDSIWENIYNYATGSKPDATQNQDDEMNEQDWTRLQNMLDDKEKASNTYADKAVAKALAKNEKPADEPPKDEANKAEVEALQTNLDAMTAERDDAVAEVAELSQPAPNTPQTPENTGASDDKPKYNY